MYNVPFYRSFRDMLSAAEQDFPDLLFFADAAGNRRLYGEFCRDIRKTAMRMTGGNVLPAGKRREGDRYVVLSVKDQYRFAVCYFAAVLAGYTVCLLPGGHPVPEGLKGARVLDEEDSAGLLKEDDASDVEDIPFSGFPEPDPDTSCTVAFSSGTSARDKGCLLSQKNLLHDAEYTMQLYHYWKGERLVHILPFWHLFGLIADLIGPLHYGGCLFDPLDKVRFFRALRDFHPDSVNMPPALADTLYMRLAVCSDPAEVSGGCLKKILCAGAALSDKTADGLMKYGIEPCTAYGLTECSPCVAVTPDGEAKEAEGTVGYPIGCVDVRIKDGEITVSGTTVMKGYFGDDELTRKVLKDGRIYTGDTGYFDAEGRLAVVGRKDNLLVFASGRKCIPEKVEKLVSSIPGIREALLSGDSGPGSLVPHLTLVSDRFTEEMRRQVSELMKKEELYPYILTISEERLRRNAMGKVVRRR